MVHSFLAVPSSHFGTPGTAGTSDHTVGTIGPIDTTRPSLWTFGFVPWDLGFGLSLEFIPLGFGICLKAPIFALPKRKGGGERKFLR